MSPPEVKCHYDVLSIPRDADAATIKKAHRKLALKYHPDKTGGCEESAQTFRLVQAAYECLSDDAERKWYDDHREAILRGWDGTGGGGVDGGEVSFVFDVVPYQYAGCYDGYGDGDGGFFSVYGEVFRKVYEGERNGWVDAGNIDLDDMPLRLSVDFGTGSSDWSDVSTFYAAWEGFNSSLNYAWADKYDTREAPNRRVRRAMDDENRKARRIAKRERNEDVLSLVRFVKRRDPRVSKNRVRVERERIEREVEARREAERKRSDAALAREAWRAEAEKAMAQTEAEDLNAGRVRLADLDSDDDDEYYGKKGRKKRGKKKKGKKKQKNWSDDDDENDAGEAKNDERGEGGAQNNSETSALPTDENGGGGNDDDHDADATAGSPSDGPDDGDASDGERNGGPPEGTEARPPPEAVDDDDDARRPASEEEEEEEEPPDFWKCECCRKNFKSENQFENHVKSKKHREAYKKYEKKLSKEKKKKKREEEEEAEKEKDEREMEELLDEMAMEP